MKRPLIEDLLHVLILFGLCLYFTACSSVPRRTAADAPPVSSAPEAPVVVEAAPAPAAEPQTDPYAGLESQPDAFDVAASKETAHAEMYDAFRAELLERCMRRGCDFSMPAYFELKWRIDQKQAGR